MNSNRGQYNSTPLYNLKSKRAEEKKEAQQQAAAAEPAVQRKRYAGLSIVMSLVLPVLFVVSLVVPNNIIRWVFLGLTALCLLAMWALRAFVKSARSTLTVIYAALAVVIGLALFINHQAPEARTAAGGMDQNAWFGSRDAASVNAMINEMATEPPATPEPVAPGQSEAEKQLEGFFSAWALNSASEMLPYCLPSWVSSHESPKSTLFQMLSRSSPVSYQIEGITGSDGDSNRIVTVKVNLVESGQQTVQRMHVMMQKINDMWYVNPDSLDGVPVDEAAEAALAALAEEAGDIPQNTIAPTATPIPDDMKSGIVVYYNEDGGKYYHANRTCEAVRSEFWPLTEFSFDLINSQQFKNLKPCTKCNPPARPNVDQ